jgi:hypothetical protein
MKIFLDNYKPIHLLPLLSGLEKYFISSLNRIDVYGDMGQFHIYNEKIYQLEDIIDYPITHYVLDNFTLILDKSSFQLKEVVSLPNNHIYHNLIINKYSIHKPTNPSSLFLIIEGNNCSTQHQPQFKQTHPYSFIPHHFYFELEDEKCSLEQCKEELIEFLYLLN